MSRHAKFVLFGRCCLAVIVITVCVLVFGPFQGAEAHFGLTDKEAHALAFYVLTSLGVLAAPRIRKYDVALLMLAFGGFIEIVQTGIGRDGDIFDWLADSLGVAMAVLPMTIEKARIYFRGEQPRHPMRRRGDRTAGATVPASHI